MTNIIAEYSDSILVQEPGDILLQQYHGVKRVMKRARGYMDPVSQLVRGTSTVLQTLQRVIGPALPVILKVLHYLPYVSSIYVVIDNMRRIADAIGSDKKTMPERLGILAHAGASIVLTILFTFTLASPFAGLLASTTADLGYHTVFRPINRLVKHFFGKVQDYKTKLAVTRAEISKTVDDLNVLEYLFEKNQLSSQGITYFDHQTKQFNKLLNVERYYEHQIKRSEAKIKENSFNGAIAAVAFTGALLSMIPGLQIPGAALLLVAGTVYLADKLFNFPFPWRKSMAKAPAATENQSTATIMEKLGKPENGTKAIDELRSKVPMQYLTRTAPERTKPQAKPTFFQPAPSIEICLNSTHIAQIKPNK